MRKNRLKRDKLLKVTGNKQSPTIPYVSKNSSSPGPGAYQPKASLILRRAATIRMVRDGKKKKVDVRDLISSKSANQTLNNTAPETSKEEPEIAVTRKKGITFPKSD